jgi:hypothetical protein
LTKALGGSVFQKIDETKVSGLIGRRRNKYQDL